MPVKAVLFDMDGVLVDVSGSYRRAVEETAAFFTGRPVDPGLVQEYKNRGGFNDDWKLTHAIVTDRGFNVPFATIVDEFQKRYRGETFDGFIAGERPLVKLRVLEEAASYGPTALVTGRPEAEARWTLRHFGWEPFFPIVVAMEQQEGKGKPDPFCLVCALETIHRTNPDIEPREAVYIGDTGDDMLAARAAGFQAVGVVPPYLPADTHTALLLQKGAHHVITSMNDLPEVLRMC